MSFQLKKEDSLFFIGPFKAVHAKQQFSLYYYNHTDLVIVSVSEQFTVSFEVQGYPEIFRAKVKPLALS